MIRGGQVGCAVVASELSDVSGVQGVPILRAADAQVKVIFSAPSDDAELESRVRALDVFYYHIKTDGDGDLAAAVEAAVGRPRKVPQAAGILVVDDDPLFRDLLRTMLEHDGHRVTVAGSGTDGLILARKRPPDLIVVDIMMETATDGFQLVHELRRDPQLRHTPVVAVSAVPRRVGLAPPFAEGDELSRVDAYFTKPVDASEFLAGVRELLGRGG